MKRPQCASCISFKKLRGYSFGECNNDEFFQYCEDKKELKELNTHALVIIGEGVPYVGVDYCCSNYKARGSKSSEVFSFPLSSMNSGRRSYSPPAKNKRKGGVYYDNAAPVYDYPMDGEEDIDEEYIAPRQVAQKIPPRKAQGVGQFLLNERQQRELEEVNKKKADLIERLKEGIEEKYKEGKL